MSPRQLGISARQLGLNPKNLQGMTKEEIKQMANQLTVIVTTHTA